MNLETENLLCRPFELTDAGFIVELVNSEGWLKYIGDRKIHSAADAIRYLNNGPLKSYAQHRFGLCMVLYRAGNIPIGMCGLIKRDTLEQPDLGFAFLPAWSGKGYASEMSKAIIQHAFSHLNLAELSAITDPENDASIAVLRKCGFMQERHITLPGDSKQLLKFQLINPIK
jgi:RimJ/RimL family protein N-acetyltransferase